MNIEELYHFLFETMPGIGILVGGGLVISIIVCFILERKTPSSSRTTRRPRTTGRCSMTTRTKANSFAPAARKPSA